MALIRHDQAHLRQGAEEGGARPDDHFQQSQARPPPGIVALPGGEPGVHQPHLPGEARQEAAHHLRGDGNLGHQDDG